eukprot:scaffold54356_cov45-Attheya_sp.AAC.4
MERYQHGYQVLFFRKNPGTTGLMTFLMRPGCRDDKLRLRGCVSCTMYRTGVRMVGSSTCMYEERTKNVCVSSTSGFPHSEENVR